MLSECQTLWDLARRAHRVSILSDELVTELGGEKYLFCEEELVIGARFAADIYKSALKHLKGQGREDVYLDLAVAINGELSLAWNAKMKNLDSLDIEKELHFNSLSVLLHRKAAVAWEFRKAIIKKIGRIPDGELDLILDMAEMHKQNYYLWEYRRWLFQNWIAEENKGAEIQKLMRYCEIHPSDSSSFHYLSECVKNMNCENLAYEWIVGLCDKYYGQRGLYTETFPPGYETLNLFRAKVRADFMCDKAYFDEQKLLDRNVKYLYFKV